MGNGFKGFTTDSPNQGQINVIDFVSKIFDKGLFICSQNTDRYLGYLEDCPCEMAFGDDSAELLDLYQDDPYYLVDCLIPRLEEAFDNFSFEVNPAEYNPCCIQIYPIRRFIHLK